MNFQDICSLKDIDSGFRPGIDDWEFTNYGSYITPDGECEGQSLTALWYYDTSPMVKIYASMAATTITATSRQPQIFGRMILRDIVLFSVAQADIDTGTFANNFWLNLGGKNWVLENNKWNMVNVAGISNEATWDLFAYFNSSHTSTAVGDNLEPNWRRARHE